MGYLGEKTRSSDGQTELAHGMKSRGTPVKELLDKFWNCSAGGPVLGQLGNLLWSRDLSSQQKPEETFGQRLAAARSLRKQLLAFGNCLATKPNALL